MSSGKVGLIGGVGDGRRGGKAGRAGRKPERLVRLTSWQAGAQPFVPAQRDLRMNCAVAQFTSSAPTVAGATKRGGGTAGRAGGKPERVARLTSWQAGAQPFVPAQRDLRMNCAVAQFTSSAPTVAGATKRGGGTAGGSRTAPTGRVLVFGRELRWQIARDGVGGCRDWRGCVGALGGGASCEPEHGLGGGCGFGGGFCEGGSGFAGWGIGSGGGGVRE